MSHAHRVHRRSFLDLTALAGGSLWLPAGAAESDPAAGSSGFTHRALNGWITDLATAPDPQAAWPSMRLDDPLLADYGETFTLMKRLGMSEIVIWGLYVANAWPVDLARAVSDERGARVGRLIAMAHEKGIKVLSGLGVYSWGFADIIKAHPALNGGNPNAMCASEPESQRWMEKVVDFVFTRFPIDGVSMQSADQGRCKCSRCREQGDAAYHAGLITRTAGYIRQKWPGKVIGMNNWGVSFSRPADTATFAAMSRSLDYLIDHDDSARQGGPAARRDFIAAMACAHGTTGGLVVEPPQHWERDRWFLPTARRVHAHLQKLYAEGGRACEFFFHIAANPASEFTLHVAARTLAAPAEPIESHLHPVLDDLYHPPDAAVRDELARFFAFAEEAYGRYLPFDQCGTVSLEPLAGDRPGPPVYLTDRLTPARRLAYARDVTRLAAAWETLRSALPASPRVDRVTACLARVARDLA